MRGSLRGHLLLACSLALVGGSVSVAPVAASCVSIGMLLPEASSPDAMVLVGTVGASDQTHTQLQVDAWYLGDAPWDRLWVVGGRTPGTITSVDWTPQPGERFVVIARDVQGSFVTGTCEQAGLTPELLAVLADRYGEPQLPPFPEVSPDPSSWPDASAGPSPVITSADAPSPGSVVHGSPVP